MDDRRLEQCVAAVAEVALSDCGFVSAIDIFLGLGWSLADRRLAVTDGSTAQSA